MSLSITRSQQVRERNAAICEAFRNGVDIHTVAREFDVSEGTVWGALHQNGIHGGRAALRAPEVRQRNAAICEASRNGADIPTLCQKFNLSKITIVQILRENGIGRDATREERNAVIAEMHRFGLTVDDMMFEFNLSLSAVCKILKNLGLLPTRSSDREQQERNAAICEAFRNGSSRSELMKQFGLGEHGIYKVLQTGGLIIPTSQRVSQTAERDDDIRQARQAGASIEDLVARFGITSNHIYFILRGRPKEPAERRESSQEVRIRDAAICEAFRNNDSTYRKLAEQFKVSRATVYQALKAAGLTAKANTAGN